MPKATQLSAFGPAAMRRQPGEGAGGKGGRLRRSAELPQPRSRAGNTAHRKCGSWRKPQAGLMAYRRGPALFWLRRRLRADRRDLFPTCPNEDASAEQKGRGKVSKPTKAPGPDRTQESYEEKRARVKRRRSVTLRISSTKRCAAYGRNGPGASDDQLRLRRTGPSGQAATEAGRRPGESGKPETPVRQQEQMRCSAVWDPLSLCRRRPAASRSDADGRSARHKAVRQGREADGTAARSEGERGWSTVRKGSAGASVQVRCPAQPPEGTGTGMYHRQKMILFCRRGTRYRGPAAYDRRHEDRATICTPLPTGRSI